MTRKTTFLIFLFMASVVYGQRILIRMLVVWKTPAGD